MDLLIQIFEFPSSVLLAAMLLLSVFAVHRYAGASKVVRFMSTPRMAIMLLAVGAILLAVEGTWSVEVHRSAVFLVYALILLVSLALTVLNGFKRKAKAGFLLNHIGIFIIVWAALFGAPDVTKSKMIVGKGHTENTAYMDNGLMQPLSFTVSLQDFSIEYYDDGKSPKQFTSSIIVGGEKMETSVNSPCSYGGYNIYQDGYDQQGGRYTILQLVRDPWLPVTYLGMVLLAVGSVMLLFSRWKAKITLPVTLLLTVVFTILTVAKINFETLMPALRSWWFVPHLFIYMVAYALMAMALVAWIVENKRDSTSDVSDNLVRSSCALLIIGMLTGSVWAKQAWGDYWAWDPKENWAAATWFLGLIYLHLSGRRTVRGILIIILAFLALQITWYGVNYLPSAANSMHTYTN